MNRIHSITTAWLLCGAAAALGQNLLTNPGFESQGNGWTLALQGGTVAQATVTYPTTGAHGGTQYARIEVTEPAASAAENWHVQFQPQGWEAGVGATYEFKFWGKSDSSSGIHVSVQGSDYAYITGTSFGLTPDWTEYSLTYVSDAEGTDAVRFHVYVGEFRDVYSFDDFSVTALTAGVRDGGPAASQGLRVRQEAGALVLSLGAAAGEGWKAELFDLKGTSVASSTARAEGTLRMALPRKSGTYLVRASTPTRSWVRKVLVP